MNDKAMMAADLLQRVMETAKAAVPDSISEDMRTNVKAAIQDVIKDLDVVTREELEVQQAVLSKTRAKVDEMEKIIAKLEEKLS
ncbi:accessory factor UbiK family protein [Arenicella sp. 4NH20-0111]|uniref:accessory factor UbiK family protein n=1 Tax=Arenicella sp. 4NH20-0111 TaxID=3127648 RepID=UPI00310C1F0B